jgi:hypothetical protein
MRADGSSDGHDIDGDRGVHGDEFPDPDRLVILRSYLRSDAGYHMDGVAYRGAVVIAACGQLRIASPSFTHSWPKSPQPARSAALRTAMWARG